MKDPDDGNCNPHRGRMVLEGNDSQDESNDEADNC